MEFYDEEGGVRDLFRQLTSLALTTEQIDGVLAIIEAREKAYKDAEESRKAQVRERVQRWRNKQPKDDVTLPKHNGNGVKRLTRGVDSSSKKVITEEKKDISLREQQEAEFWAAYPRKVGKPAALKALSAALKKTDFATIMAGVVRYAGERAGQDPQFTKHPGPWLNGEHWADEPMPAIIPKATAPPPQRTVRDVVSEIANGTYGHATQPDRTISASYTGGNRGGASNLVRLHARPAIDEP